MITISLSKLTILLFLFFFTIKPTLSIINYGSISPGNLKGTSFNWVDDAGVFLASQNRAFNLALTNNPSSSSSFFLAVSHPSSSTVVWTANPNSPLSISDVLQFTSAGDLRLVSSSTGSILWQTNTSSSGVTAMTLLNSGNLVINSSNGVVVWQSFDHPADTLVSGQVFRPGMRLNSQDCKYFLEMGDGDLGLFADFSPPQKYWSLSSDRRGGNFSSVGAAMVTTSGWVFFREDGRTLSGRMGFPGGAFPNSSVVFLTLTVGGSIDYKAGGTSGTIGSSATLIPENYCDRPSPCQSLRVCSGGSACACPESITKLFGSCSDSMLSSSSFCNSSAKTQPSPSFYEIGGGFGYIGVKFRQRENVSGLTDCQSRCLKECNCKVLMYQGSSNLCYTWTEIGSLQLASNGSSSFDVYLKVAEKVESAGNRGNGTRPPWLVPVIVITGIGLITLSVILTLVIWRRGLRKRRTKKGEEYASGEDDYGSEDVLEMVVGLPTRFTFKGLHEATENFRQVLGVGGFGSVYEGKLPDGRRVAVKRLEKIAQGKKEFQAEVATIGSIHHVHLVKLCGFCAEGKHRLLVYEFMPNGSLDKYVFPKTNSGNARVLDWNKRFEIAIGTAKGLAYLHEECAARIIHCDIKPENILLDENFKAKVSDFGLAKLLSREESQAFTTMRGTRGYLAPEWLTTSAVSTRSDVYSFGMVLLELIGGRKNFDPSESSEKCYFPAYAYRREGEGRLGELVDDRLKDVDVEEVKRCVKVAMWCVQEDCSLRPTMGRVVKMLVGSLEIPALPATPPHGFRLNLSQLRVGDVFVSSGSWSGQGKSTTATSETSDGGLGPGILVMSGDELSGPR